MNAAERLRAALSECPLVAVLRGIQVQETDAVGDALVEAGIRLIEVPLNSPDPLASIARLAARLAGRAMVGAGTVLSPDDVEAVRNAGGALIVSPNTDTAVIRAAVDGDLISLPGYFTPSEAFAAIGAGAHGLKLFPAEGASPAMLKAQRVVLPRDLPVLAMGGITPDTMREWRQAGANGFGLGSYLYSPGKGAAAVAEDARRFVAAVRGL